jgi:hypothetical protein
MRTMLRRATVGAVSLATLATGAVVMASPATASTHCNTSSKTVDNRGYSGPWADNWTLTSTVCAYRSGSYIYGYAKIKWDAPTFRGNGSTFDGAGFRVYLKKSLSGATDPIRSYKTFDIEGRMENGDGSYTTSTFRYPISRYALADGAWKINWNNDGDGTIHYSVTGSPRV